MITQERLVLGSWNFIGSLVMVSRGSLLFFKSVGQGSRSLRLGYIKRWPDNNSRMHVPWSWNFIGSLVRTSISVKKPFTNASRGAFRVQRTLVFHYVRQGQVVCQYWIPPVCLVANYTKTLYRHHILFFANIVGQILYLPFVIIWLSCL